MRYKGKGDKGLLKMSFFSENALKINDFMNPV
jgi:hypothetical protein